MKKTKFMRAALLLLVLTLITSCFVGGTFAKYTTSNTGKDNARVAKWGFKADENSIVLTDLFKDAYKTGDAENVKSTVDVIAPGTVGSVEFGFAYDTTNNGAVAPEVAYTFEVSTTGSSCDQSIQDNANIQWKLDENGAWGTWDDMIAAIKALSGDATGTKTYKPGELPTAFSSADTKHTISWQWLFDSTIEGATDLDTTDTGMGNADTLANVTLKITVSATQID